MRASRRAGDASRLAQFLEFSPSPFARMKAAQYIGSFAPAPSGTRCSAR